MKTGVLVVAVELKVGHAFFLFHHWRLELSESEAVHNFSLEETKWLEVPWIWMPLTKSESEVEMWSVSLKELAQPDRLKVVGENLQHKSVDPFSSTQSPNQVWRFWFDFAVRVRLGIFCCRMHHDRQQGDASNPISVHNRIGPRERQSKTKDISSHGLKVPKLKSWAPKKSVSDE